MWKAVLSTVWSFIKEMMFYVGFFLVVALVAGMLPEHWNRGPIAGSLVGVGVFFGIAFHLLRRDPAFRGRAAKPPIETQESISSRQDAKPSQPPVTSSEILCGARCQASLDKSPIVLIRHVTAHQGLRRSCRLSGGAAGRCWGLRRIGIETHGRLVPSH
jgi:hypothetical protein